MPHAEFRLDRKGRIDHSPPHGSGRSRDLPALERSPLYSEEVGISLGSGRESDCFRWFLASLLFGARIGGTIAQNTYRAVIRHGLTTPRKILDAGWEFLVNPIMREGGYVRYDGRKSEQVLRDCRALLDDYDGRVLELHERARDARELEARLLAFYGVGPVTVNIFLRELRPFWRKADPEPLDRVKALAKERAVELAAYRRKSMRFARIEAGLIRRAHTLRQKTRLTTP